MALRDILSVVGKLLMASLIVGLVLSWLDINPRRLLSDIPGAIRDALQVGVDLVDWAVPYILLGAMIVVPIWAALALLRMLRR